MILATKDYKRGCAQHFSLRDQDKEKLKDNSKVATRERARLQCRELWIGHH